MKKVTAYVKAIASYKFSDPMGLSAKRARKFLELLNTKGAQAVLEEAETLRHNNRKLTTGEFVQVLSICALGRYDMYGKLTPYIREDLSYIAREILDNPNI